MKTPMVITLNGPPQIGKSWLAGQLMEILSADFKVTRLALKDLIWQEVVQRVKWNGDYESFKRHVFYHDTAMGITGREIMIQHAEAKRAESIHYWDEQYLQRDELIGGHFDVVINETLRKPEELEFLQRMLRADRLISITISPTRYSVGHQFDGDSGICLPHINGFRAVDSNQALSSFKKRLSDAQSGDLNPIRSGAWRFFRMESGMD